MANQLIHQPDMGLNSLVPDNMIDPREAASGSQDFIYERGLMRTPDGFAKVDLTTTGLNSGDAVLAIYKYIELDGTAHVIAQTTQEIYKHNRASGTWDNITGAGSAVNAGQMDSNAIAPISVVTIGHDDTTIYLDDDSNKANAYHHCVTCDGGNTQILRWAGKYEADFAPVLGADAYSDATHHKAFQVGSHRSRMLLINPQSYSSSSAIWTTNNQQVRWPTVGKLETWTGTGSGFVQLYETGGRNMWSGGLGLDYIVYQDNTIWSMNYVGGTVIYDPRPMIKDLGLLAANMWLGDKNTHYFVGNDYNVYSYYGGTVLKRIGDKIRDLLEADMNTDFNYKARMSLDKSAKRVWIFIVAGTGEFITKAYGYDMATGAWMVRDFSEVWGTPTTAGITAVNLVPGGSYEIGETYQQALDSNSIYDAADTTGAAGDVTLKYGDVLRGDTTANVIDWTTLDATLDFTDVEFSAGGLFFCFSASADPTVLVGDNTDYSNLILRIDDGSYSSDMPSGSHYYTVTDISSVDSGGGDYTVRVNLMPVESTGCAAADLSTDTPVLSADTTATLFDASGITYSQKIDTVVTEDAMHIGDSIGFVYKFSTDVTSYSGTAITAEHYSPVIDAAMPTVHKRWPGIVIDAKGDSIVVDWKLDDGSWSANTATTLSSVFTEYRLFINRTSRKIQIRIKNDSGNTTQVRSYGLIDPEIQDNR